MIYEISDTNIVSHLFANWDETLIWSCLQGVMGKIYANDIENPTSALAIIADFAFFAGNPNLELVAFKPDWFKSDFILMIPKTEEWTTIIEQYYGERATVFLRYALKKEPEVFDKDKLQKAVNALPLEYEISLIDEAIYNQCCLEDWSNDWVSQFDNYKHFRELGLGVVIRKEKQLIAGAASYTVYKGGIEIQIDTKPEYRKRGLGYVCASKLILECLKRNLYPSWDAHNIPSLSLAQKLGYHFSHSYTTIEIKNY